MCDRVCQYACHLVRAVASVTHSARSHQFCHTASVTPRPCHVQVRCRPTAFEEPTLSRAFHVGRTTGLHRFNALPPGAAEATLLACCGSRRWARRMAAHRPYHDVDSLLAASDEASYDLSHADLAEALAAESSSGPPHSAPSAARTALRAAHAAYESSFGHAFVISLDGHRPEECLNQVLAGIRARLSHDPDHERSVSADELRRLARGRLARLLASGLTAGAVGSAAETAAEAGHSGCADNPSVAV